MLTVITAGRAYHLWCRIHPDLPSPFSPKLADKRQLLIFQILVCQFRYVKKSVIFLLIVFETNLVLERENCIPCQLTSSQNLHVFYVSQSLTSFRRTRCNPYLKQWLDRAVAFLQIPQCRRMLAQIMRLRSSGLRELLSFLQTSFFLVENKIICFQVPVLYFLYF